MSSTPAQQRRGELVDSLTRMSMTPSNLGEANKTGLKDCCTAATKWLQENKDNNPLLEDALGDAAIGKKFTQLKPANLRAMTQADAIRLLHVSFCHVYTKEVNTWQPLTKCCYLGKKKFESGWFQPLAGVLAGETQPPAAAAAVEAATQADGAGGSQPSPKKTRKRARKPTTPAHKYAQWKELSVTPRAVNTFKNVGVTGIGDGGHSPREIHARSRKVKAAPWLERTMLMCHVGRYCVMEMTRSLGFYLQKRAKKRVPGEEDEQVHPLQQVVGEVEDVDPKILLEGNEDAGEINQALMSVINKGEYHSEKAAHLFDINPVDSSKRSITPIGILTEFLLVNEIHKNTDKDQPIQYTPAEGNTQELRVLIKLREAAADIADKLGATQDSQRTTVFDHLVHFSRRMCFYMYGEMLQEDHGVKCNDAGSGDVGSGAVVFPIAYMQRTRRGMRQAFLNAHLDEMADQFAKENGLKYKKLASTMKIEKHSHHTVCTNRTNIATAARKGSLKKDFKEVLLARVAGYKKSSNWNNELAVFERMVNGGVFKTCIGPLTWDVVTSSRPGGGAK